MTMFGTAPQGLDLYHVGIVVPDMEEALASYRAAFGFRWTDISESHLDVVVEEERRRTTRIRACYSVEGPPYLELIEDTSNNVWGGVDFELKNHTGFWAEDITSARQRLEQRAVCARRRCLSGPAAVHVSQGRQRNVDRTGGTGLPTSTDGARAGRAGEDRQPERWSMNTADVLAIQRLLADYADAVATRDQTAWAATWTDDCVWHLSGGRSSVGLVDTVALWVSAIARYPWVSQLVTNTMIDLDGDDTAHGRCTILEINRVVDGSGAMHVGSYDDRYRKSQGRWQFAERRLHLMYRASLDPGTVIPLNATEALPR